MAKRIISSEELNNIFEAQAAEAEEYENKYVQDVTYLLDEKQKIRLLHRYLNKRPNFNPDNYQPIFKEDK